MPDTDNTLEPNPNEETETAERAATSSEEDSPQEPCPRSEPAQASREETEPPASSSLAAELDGTKDKLLRTLAEMENLRRRVQRDREEAIRFANENLLRELLPVLDHLALAVSFGKVDHVRVEDVAEGVSYVLKQFEDTLARFGVVPFDAVGKAFDPELHEAVDREPSDTVPPGTILKTHQRGYRLRERLLRPARVVVATEVPVPVALDEKVEDEELEESSDAATAGNGGTGESAELKVIVNEAT